MKNTNKWRCYAVLIFVSAISSVLCLLFAPGLWKIGACGFLGALWAAMWKQEGVNQSRKLDNEEAKIISGTPSPSCSNCTVAVEKSAKEEWITMCCCFEKYQVAMRNFRSELEKKAKPKDEKEKLTLEEIILFLNDFEIGLAEFRKDIDNVTSAIAVFRDTEVVGIIGSK